MTISKNGNQSFNYNFLFNYQPVLQKLIENKTQIILN